MKRDYEAACKEASEKQGVDVILAKLHEKGVTEAYIWQSGGFTMTIRIDRPNQRTVLASAEGVSFYDVGDDGALHGENIFTENVDEIVAAIVKEVKG